MFRINFIQLCIFLVLFLVFTACKKDDAKPQTSRTIKFEVTGNFSGSLNTIYITSSGGGTTESISALPWTKEITYQSSVPSTSLSVVGAGGTAGQTITVKVIAGSQEKSSTTGTATNSGTVSVAAPSLVF